MTADFYSFRAWPATKEAWSEMACLLRKEGATFFRATVFNDVHPSDIYPHGLYLEGWKIEPKDQGPFDWPMTATPTAGK